MRSFLLAAVAIATASLSMPFGSGDEPASLVTLDAHCHPDVKAYAAMETDYYRSGCWGHWGGHTYFVGRDRVYGLRDGYARVFATEQQFSPPADGYAPSAVPLRVTTPIVVETSLDGVTWNESATARYRFAPPNLPVTGHFVYVHWDGGDEPFRFLRFREPESLAQGLSGYLDHSLWILNVTDLGPAPPPTLGPGNLTLSCDDGRHMEAIFALHPCAYGGVDRWDAPSWFHTYFVGNASLTGIAGHATLRYFRPDDPGQPLTGVVGGPVRVQASVDGITWATVGAFQAQYEQEATFAMAFDPPVNASFVRVVSEKHPGWVPGPPTSDDPLKHPEAFLLHSDVTLAGLVPLSE